MTGSEGLDCSWWMVTWERAASIRGIERDSCLNDGRQVERKKDLRVSRVMNMLIEVAK